MSIYGMQVVPLTNTFLTSTREFQRLESHINEGQIYHCHKDREEAFQNKKTYRYTENKNRNDSNVLTFLMN